jgi:hypothetical protein
VTKSPSSPPVQTHSMDGCSKSSAFFCSFQMGHGSICLSKVLVLGATVGELQDMRPCHSPSPWTKHTLSSNSMTVAAESVRLCVGVAWRYSYDILV